MDMVLNTALAVYIGNNELIKIRMDSLPETVAILEGDSTRLWMLDGTEIEVPRSDIQILSTQRMDDKDWFWNNLPSILIHKIHRDGLPDQALVEWGEGKTWNWLSRHYRESGFTYQEARSIFHFHREMGKIFPNWNKENIMKCWKKATKESD